MIRKVNPTRINLLNLKRELKVARRGHKLLKDKRDGLMKKFMGTIRRTKELRGAVEEEMSDLFRSYTRASVAMSRTSVSTAFMLPNARITIDVTNASIMSVETPLFTLKREGSLLSYGMLETHGELDAAIVKLDALFPHLIELAQLEKTITNLATEIERTRRRASALENTRIPSLASAIRFITSRLEEQARDTIVGAMRIKAMIVAKELQTV